MSREPGPRAFWSWAAGFAALGLALRLRTASSAPLFADEGFFTETAQSLAAGARPQIGAFWQDGFLPLTTSLAAPLSALPFQLLPWLDAMEAARLWAALCGALGVLVAAWLGRRLDGGTAGILAAAFFAAHPFATEFGGRAFYHHFSALLLPLSLAAFLSGGRRALAASALLAGLAVAGAYWLWWALPCLALLAARCWGWGALPRFAAWAALPLALAVSLNFYPDPQAAWWSVGNLRRSFGAGTPAGPLELLAAFYKVLRAFPFLAAGLLGCMLASGRTWAPFLLGLGCLLEPVRQRGGIVGMPYPFILALPWIYLGLGLAAARALRPGLLSKAAMALPLALLVPSNLNWFQLAAVDHGRALEMAAALKGMARPGAKVLGLGNFNWALRPELRPFEPAELGAHEGRDSAYFFAPVPARRFAFACPLEEAEYMVACRVHFLGMMEMPGVRETFRRVEKEGWPEAWSNKSFKVFKNPRFKGLPGAPRGPKIPTFQLPPEAGIP